MNRIKGNTLFVCSSAPKYAAFLVALGWPRDAAEYEAEAFIAKRLPDIVRQFQLEHPNIEEIKWKGSYRLWAAGFCRQQARDLTFVAFGPTPMYELAKTLDERIKKDLLSIERPASKEGSAESGLTKEKVIRYITAYLRSCEKPPIRYEIEKFVSNGLETPLHDKISHFLRKLVEGGAVYIVPVMVNGHWHRGFVIKGSPAEDSLPAKTPRFKRWLDEIDFYNEITKLKSVKLTPIAERRTEEVLFVNVDPVRYAFFIGGSGRSKVPFEEEERVSKYYIANILPDIVRRAVEKYPRPVRVQYVTQHQTWDRHFVEYGPGELRELACELDRTIAWDLIKRYCPEKEEDLRESEERLQIQEEEQ